MYRQDINYLFCVETGGGKPVSAKPFRIINQNILPFLAHKKYVSKHVDTCKGYRATKTPHKPLEVLQNVNVIPAKCAIFFFENVSRIKKA